jgi:hypothetical protein
MQARYLYLKKNHYTILLPGLTLGRLQNKEVRFLIWQHGMYSPTVLTWPFSTECAVELVKSTK